MIGLDCMLKEEVFGSITMTRANGVLEFYCVPSIVTQCFTYLAPFNSHNIAMDTTISSFEE